MIRHLKNALLVLALASTSTLAAETVLVGGMEMYPKKDIIDNAVNSADHKTLVTAVKEADLNKAS